MPKREIIPEPIVTVIDDYDGKELHPDTPPERYRINGRTYELYLSDESKKIVDDFLRNLLDGAQEIRDTPAPRSGRGRGDRTSLVCRRFGAHPGWRHLARGVAILHVRRE